MYKLNYYRKSFVDNVDKEKRLEYKGVGETFRLRKNALHYLYDIVQNEYREKGYTIEERKGSLHCYKSIETPEEDRRTIEIVIKVEK